MKVAKSLAFLVGLVAIPATRLPAQNVITDWNTIASTTIVKVGGKPSGAGAVWFAYAAIASYDAVNAIGGQFQPFYYSERALDGASPEAAAVSAAHRVLVHYFPSQETTRSTVCRFDGCDSSRPGRQKPWRCRRRSLCGSPDHSAFW